MIDQIFGQRQKKHTQHINIVPILDMLTTIIFFLLMSTSFIEYTKLTIPPSSTVSVAASSGTPPLTPKMFISKKEGGFEILLRWAGAQPGEKRVKIDFTSAVEVREKIISESKKTIDDFSDKYPAQKSIQLAAPRDVKYQTIISLMDGVREKMPDIILVAYSEAEARLAAQQP